MTHNIRIATGLAVLAIALIAVGIFGGQPLVLALGLLPLGAAAVRFVKEEWL